MKMYDYFKRHLGSIVSTILSILVLYLFVFNEIDDPYNICSRCHLIIVLICFLWFAVSISLMLDSEWFSSFVRHRKNIYKTVVTIIFISMPLGCLIIEREHVSLDNKDFISHWGVFLSIISIFIGMKVYMGFIGDKERHSFKEFIDILSDLFDDAHQGDEIYLLLPTIQIGAAGQRNQRFARKFKESIEDFINKESIKLELGILDYNIDIINSFLESIKNRYPNLIPQDINNRKELRNNIEKMEKMPSHTIYVELHKNLIDKGGALFSFHKEWYKETEDKEEIFFYLDLSLFLQKLDGLQTSEKLIIHKINKQYFRTRADIADANKNNDTDKGLFLYINQTKQRAYCGNIIISSQEHIEFQNITVRKDDELCDIFVGLFKSFVNNNAKNTNI